MPQPTKILIVGPAWVGDMMMAQVLFQLLRQHHQHCEIHVLAPAWCEALLTRMPQVTKAIELPFAHGELALRKRYQFAKQLRAAKYDQAIVLPNSFKSALIPFWAQIPKRRGWLGEYRFGLLNEVRRLNKKQLPLMVERFGALAYESTAQMAANLPVPLLSVKQEDVSRSVAKFSLDANKPILALCPGAEFGPSKCWPLEYYAAVANEKLAQGYAVWLFGSAKDRTITDIINQLTHEKCDNLAGKTSLSQAVDLLSLAEYVVTNDSGLMHIAAALDRNVIAIYGSTSPDFTPPLTDKAKILTTQLDCQPCFKRQCPLKHHNCMKQILPEQVLQAM